MNKTSQVTQIKNLCKTDFEENYGSKALDILKEKMKIYDLEKIPQLTKSHQKSPSIKSRNKSQKYQQSTNSVQKQSLSNNRISNKEQKMKNSDRFSIHTLESVKSRLSMQQAKLLDVPVVKIQKEQTQVNSSDSQNDISLILMEKYYQATIKYEEKKSRQIVKQVNKIMLKPKVVTMITQSNSAVKNLQRKLKNSRRELIKELNKSNSIYTRDMSQDVNQQYQKFRPVKTIHLNRNHSVN